MSSLLHNNDPLADIRRNANPGKPSTEGQVQQRKKRGLCISCGEVNTHVKTWFGKLAPVDSDICFSKRLCRQCYKRVQGRDGVKRKASSNSISITASPQHLKDTLSVGTVSSHGTTFQDSSSTVDRSSGRTEIHLTGGSNSTTASASASATSTIAPAWLSPLDTHLWDTRPIAIGAPQPPRPFPEPILKPGLRNVKVQVYDFMGTCKTTECVYLMRQDKRPNCVYRQVDYPGVVELPYSAGHLVFCLRLKRHASGLDYQEPPLREHTQNLVMIKRLPKKSYHKLSGGGESPLKDATALQQLGRDE